MQQMRLIAMMMMMILCGEFRRNVSSTLHLLCNTWKALIKWMTICHPHCAIFFFQRISYSNPYDQLKTFRLRTDRPDLIRFRESAFIIGAKDTYTIGLIFPPRGSPGTADIMVFIENDDKKIEETFLIKASYV